MAVELEKTPSSYLPSDIVEIIVLQSPSVKSFLRFKKVCKSWNTMISDPAFIRKHLKQSKNSPNNNNLFLSTKNVLWNPYAQNVMYFEGPPTFRSLLRFKTNWKSWNTIISDSVFIRNLLENSPNNLFLNTERAHSEGGYPLFKQEGRQFRVANVVPVPPTNRDMYIECPYAYSGHCASNHGICYDRITDDFKVIFITDERYTIYSCKNNSWSKKKLGIKYHSFFEGVLVDGDTYWVLSDENCT
ncbi:hypothetical protein MIMGU_mgv11b016596mg, partial [Erythranthe guttata]